MDEINAALYPKKKKKRGRPPKTNINEDSKLSKDLSIKNSEIINKKNKATTIINKKIKAFVEITKDGNYKLINADNPVLTKKSGNVYKELVEVYEVIVKFIPINNEDITEFDDLVIFIPNEGIGTVKFMKEQNRLSTGMTVYEIGQTYTYAITLKKKKRKCKKILS